MASCIPAVLVLLGVRPHHDFLSEREEKNGEERAHARGKGCKHLVVNVTSFLEGFWNFSCLGCARLEPIHVVVA